MSTLTLDAIEALFAKLGMRTPLPRLENLEILSNILDLFRCYLAGLLQTVVNIAPEGIVSAIQFPTTVDPAIGDVSIILPKLAREVGIKVEDLSDMIRKEFPIDPLFGPPGPDGAQLKIFYHSSETLAQILVPYILDRGTRYGLCSKVQVTQRPKVVIELSSPNIVAEMNGKHFRSTILGAQLATAFESQGWSVVKTNFLGDYGKPIGLLGAGFSRFGSKEELEENPLAHLRDVYRKITVLFEPEQQASKKARDDEKSRSETGHSAEIESKGIFAERNAFVSRLENGDEEAVALWKALLEASSEEYRRIYDNFGVDFDEFSGESQVKVETMDEVENLLRAKNLIEESDGSLVIHLQHQNNKHGAAIIRDRTGSRTYLLRDLASAIERERRFGFDRLLYVVANDQHTLHFQRIKKIMEMLDMADLATKIDHVPFHEASHLLEPSDPGDTLLQTFDKLANAIQKSMDERLAQGKASLPMQDCPESLAASACYAQACAVKRNAELKFPVKHLASFDPGTALLLLEWLKRLGQLLQTPPEQPEDTEEPENYSDDFGNAIVLRWLSHYPEVVNSAFKNLEPANVMTYLNNITSQLSDCYEDDEEICPISASHGEFLRAVHQVMANGLKQVNIMRDDRTRDSGVFVRTLSSCEQGHTRIPN